MVQNAILKTPDLTRCGVAGIMRGRILEMAKQHAIEIRIQPVELHTLLQSDEVFVCNSLAGIWPVIAIDEYTFPKGAVTTRLQALLAAEVTTGKTGFPV